MSTERSAIRPTRPPAALTPLTPSVVVLLDVAVVIVTATLIAMVTLGINGPLRVVLALAFVTFVPGWALLDHLTLVAGGTARLALSVALSLTLSTLIALALLWLHLWHPIAQLDVLGVLCLLAVAVHLRRSDLAFRISAEARHER